MEYRAEELAIKAGTTVRNLRAYRDHGILAPPERRGRSAFYNDSHLDRLQLISKLIGRGYTLANIGELLAGQARGVDVAELLGVEAALLEPTPSGMGNVLTGAQLMKLYGDTDGTRVDASTRVGLIEPIDGDVALPERRYLVRKPRAFRAGRDLVEAGVPLDVAIAQSGLIAKGVQPIAHQLVMLVADRLLQDAESALAGNDSGQQAAIIGVAQGLRPLAGGVVAEELALAMDEQIRKHLGHLIDELLVETGRGRRASSNDGST
ncbi:MAG: MerR family transcriptional regulator [Aquihabitans sp.]